jgi:hypothetical protein
MQQIKVYISAKVEHAPMLAQLHPDGIHINSRWIEMADAGRKRNKPVSHWQQENFDDIRMAHFFILYSEPADYLKGSIGETFYAIAAGKKCWLAGNALSPQDEGWGLIYKPDGAPGAELRVPNKGLMPWGLYRPSIRIVSCLERAFTEIRAYANQDRILSEGVGELDQPVTF